MKNSKMLVCLFLALALPISILTGCVKAPDVPTGAFETGEQTNTNATVTPEPQAENEPASTADMLYSDAIDENGFWKDLMALDYIEMFDYRGIEIPNDIHQVSDEALQTEVDNVLANYGSPTQITDRAVVDGDTLNIDFVGSIDGVEFEGGSTGGMGTEVTIGVTQYIDDFLAQLIGHMPGDTVNVEVTFPDDYGETTLQGKDALFVTTINYIAGDTIAAELTDAFIAENLSATYGWETISDMKNDLRSNLRKLSIEQYLMEYFTTKVNVISVPTQLSDYQVNIMLNYYEEYAGYYGMELSELLASEGLNSTDELIDQYYEFNMQNATYYLVLQAIAEDAGLSVNDKDIADYFTETYGSSDYSEQEAQFGMPYVKHTVLCMKVINYIVDNAILL